MKTRILDRHHIGRIVAEVGADALMDEAIRALDATIAGLDDTTVDRARDGFRYSTPEPGLVEWMPVMRVGEQVTIKVVGYHPTNPARRGLPTIVATVGVYDTRTGHLEGLVDGTFLTALRTGAASAVASRVLARPDAARLGLVGLGAQAVTQAHAMARTFPLTHVLIADTDPDAVASFPIRTERLLPPGAVVEEASVETIMATADIVCTSTSIDPGAGPLFDDLHTPAWQHVNAVGSDLPGKTELPRALLTRSLVCPDHLAQARLEGECQQLADHEIGPTLADVLADPGRHHRHRQERTVFDSTGWAVEDLVAVELLLGHANRLGLGVLLEIEDLGGDPRDPYDIGSPIRLAPATVHQHRDTGGR